MFTRFILVAFCCSLLVSCQFFKKKELSEDAIIDTIVDYNTVDIFPLFPDCDSIPSQEKQKICSQIKLSEHLYASLAKTEISTSKSINDTLLIFLRIDSEGLVSLTNLKTSSIIKEQIPTLDSLMANSVQKLPQLKPAIKRGIPVATEFTLPIVIKN
ncbi:MAG: hypothetical protein KUG51_01490 [Urechidicola sp.]|nr:hypothetical protein [Urechidicola sp.]